MSAKVHLSVTPDEQDDIVLALRSWVADLEEPVAQPRSALARRRRAMAERITRLADRVTLADLIPME